MGGGGLAKVLIEIIRVTKDYEIVGILDSLLGIEVKVLDVPVLGKDNLLSQLYEEGISHVCIAVGSIRSSNKRSELYRNVKQIGFTTPSLVHPEANISKNSKIQDGVSIMAGAVIQADSSIGENVLIYSGAIVEHDCQINNHSHICPGVILSGGCTIGENSYIGAGATVIQGIKIGSGVTVGAGSVVIKDIPDGVTVKGVPAK